MALRARYRSFPHTVPIETDGRQYDWTYSDILTAFMYYWTSGPRDFFRLVETSDEVLKQRGSSSVRIGTFLAKQQRLPKAYVEEVLGPVVFERTRTSTGCWAAWEEPEVLADVLRAFWEIARQ
jgi:hypothetical protein